MRSISDYPMWGYFIVDGGLEVYETPDQKRHSRGMQITRTHAITYFGEPEVFMKERERLSLPRQ